MREMPHICIGGFQSTLPARGATDMFLRDMGVEHHFNPRSPHGERQADAFPRRTPHADFNPRSPHGERPLCIKLSTLRSGNFNPRSPHGERQFLNVHIWKIL